MSKRPKDIGSMVEMLKQGATLTELACPACASPLFRMKDGELWCAACEKQVIVLKEGESPEKVTRQTRLATLEDTVLAKIRAVEMRIRDEEEVDELKKLNAVLNSLLENLERLKRLKET